MESQLKKKFYKRFALTAIAVLVADIVIGALAIIFWIKFAQAKSIIVIPIVFSVVLLICMIGTVTNLIPFLMDLGRVRKNAFQVIKGTIEGNPKGADGDSPTPNYLRTVKAEDGTTFQILIVDGAQKGKRYRFLYLPHTKLAVILEEI